MDDATKRMGKAAAQLLFQQPFYGVCFLNMRRVETRRVPTMAVNGVHLFYNPDFVAELSDAELQFVIAHEVLHIALAHIPRKGGRVHSRWNVACDLAINPELVKAGFTMPKGKNAGLLDPKFDGMTAEDIYEALPADPPPSGGAGQPGAGQPQPGDGEGEGGGGAAAGIKPELAADPGRCGGMLPTPENGDGSDGSNPERVARDWEVIARQAVTQADAAKRKGGDKAGGHIPESVRRWIEELNAPVIDWRETFRRFVGDGVSDDVSWDRPNRRLVSSGIYVPGLRRDRVNRVLVLFDTSGSIGGAELTADAAEAKGMLDDAGVSAMVWACVDTRIRSHGVVSAVEELPDIDFAGGGGTNFAHAMEWAATIPDVACCVFFTDGLSSDFGAEPPFPVLWCGHGKRERWDAIAARIPYGESVYRGE